MGGKRRKAADFGGSLRPRSRMVYQIRDTENGVAGGGGRASGENESPALPPCSHRSWALFFGVALRPHWETIRLIRDGRRMGWGMRTQAHLPAHTSLSSGSNGMEVWTWKKKAKRKRSNFFSLGSLRKLSGKLNIFSTVWWCYCRFWERKQDVALVEFMYLVITSMPGESYRRRLRSCCCICVTYFERSLTPFCVDSYL